MGDGVTIPLTTIFSPAASCFTDFTYEAQLYNSIPGGLLIQNALEEPIDTACFPKGFENNGRIPSAQVYSPGWCPHGYTTPEISQGRGTTLAICCQSGYSYYSTYSTIANFPESGSMLFAGCVSTFTGNGATTVPARSVDSALNMTAVSGSITMWAQPITVKYQQSDISLFVTSTSSPTSTPASPKSTASAHQSATSSSISGGSVTATSPSLYHSQATSTLIDPLPASTSTPTNPPVTNSLSTGAQAGIGVGVSLLALGLLSVAILLLFRRRRRISSPTNAPSDTPPGANGYWVPMGQPSMAQGYAMDPGYKNVLHEAPDGTPIAELDGNRMSMKG